MPTNRARRACVLAGLAALAGCSRSAPAFRGIDLTGAPYGQDFRLLDPSGRPRTLADFRGQVVLLYFGFTQCPDVCPTALTRAARARVLLGDQGRKLQVIFVTLDPERDLPAVLAAYTAAFDPGFLGLHETPERIDAVAKDFKVHYKKVPTGGSYTLDHSTLSYAFDASGRLRLALRHDQTAEDYAHDLRLLMD